MMGFAKAVSFLLSPVFTILPIPFILVAKFSHDYSYALKWTMFSYAFVLVVMLFIFVGVTLGVFTNFDVSKREQRPLLFSFSAFVMFCYLLSLIVLNGPKILFFVIFVIAFTLLIFMIVNKRIKASVHMTTATGTLLLIGATYKGYFFLLLFLIPLLAWSRVKTKKHSLTETIVGSVLGIVITLTVYLVSKQFFFEMIYG